MSTKEQRLALMAEAEKSFEASIMPTSVGLLDEATLSVCRKCYCLGYINGGDHVLSQVSAVWFS